MTATAGNPGIFGEFWEAPYRPLFLAAFLCALLTVAWWPLGVWCGLPGPFFEPVVLWHIHELFFGFAAAAIGGYLLTALPSWTGRPPVRGAALKILMAFWVSARVATAMAEVVSPVLPVAFNAGYFLLLAGYIGRQLLLTGVFHKLGFLCAILALGLSEVLFLGAARAGFPWVSLVLVDAVIIGVVMLMVSVGTRAIPAFTGNWLAQTGCANQPEQGSTSSRLMVQMLLLIAGVAHVTGWPDIANVAMICTALALLWTMRGWHSLPALRNPLLAALHLAFLWLPLGLLAMGVSGLLPAIYLAEDALHAVTIGGMSGVIMAIAGRAAAHTSTGEMKPNWGSTIGVLLIWSSTLVRLSAPLVLAYPAEIAAAKLWCTGWLVFIIGFLPTLTGPLRRPVLSGRRVGAREVDVQVESDQSKTA